MEANLAPRSSRTFAAALLTTATLVQKASHQAMQLTGVARPYAMRRIVSLMRRRANSLLLGDPSLRLEIGTGCATPRPKPRVCLLTCLWQRPELSRVVLEYYRDIRGTLADIELELVAIGSESAASRQIAEANDFHYFEHANSPLSAKWNFGLQQTRQFHPDGVVLVGSDDLLSAGILNHYARCLHQGDLFVGFLDGCFLDLGTSSLCQWHGYAGPRWRARRLAETIGMGRLLARPLLEKLDFSLWDGQKADSRLDQLAQTKLTRLGMLPVLYEHKLPVRCGESTFHFGQLGLQSGSVPGCLLDIKTATCVTPFARYTAVEGTCTTIGEPWSYLGEFFPAGTVSALQAMGRREASLN